MRGYLIKSTYLTGPHKGRSYLVRKDGYVTEEGNCEWDVTIYRTLASVKQRCRQLTRDNERDYNNETRERDQRIQQGEPLLHEGRIYEKMSYEPYFVKV